MKSRKVLVINGPNLNLLKERETKHYGELSLRDIEDKLREMASSCKIELGFMQSNNEHTLIDTIHSCKFEQVDFILINAAAYTHTSIAIRDSLLAVNIPFIEIHMSNIYAREKFRHKSYLSDIALGVISGFGINSYALALMAAVEHLEAENELKVQEPENQTNTDAEIKSLDTKEYKSGKRTPYKRNKKNFNKQQKGQG